MTQERRPHSIAGVQARPESCCVVWLWLEGETPNGPLSCCFMCSRIPPCQQPKVSTCTRSGEGERRFLLYHT